MAEPWRRMNYNRHVGVDWATRTLLAEPGLGHFGAHDVEAVFWVALDWGTYRLLTEQLGLDAAAFERWIARYYRSMLLTK